MEINISISVTFTKSFECMPYYQANKYRYASFDRIKYVYYRGAVLQKLVLSNEPVKKIDYECMLKNLLNIEEKLKKKEGSLLLSGKYQQFVKECAGGDINKLLGNLIYNFGKSIRLSKKRKYILIPRKNGLSQKFIQQKRPDINIL